MSIDLVTADIAQGTSLVAQVFAQQAKGAGVNVNLDQPTVSNFFGPNYLKWTFAQDFWGYYPYLPMVAFETLPSSPYNETHWDNPRYNQLFAAASSTVDATKRAEISHEMQEIDYNSGGLIIPYFPPAIDGYAKNINGIQKSKVGRPLGNFNWSSIWID